MLIFPMLKKSVPAGCISAPKCSLLWDLSLINRVKEFRLWGVTITENLSWSSQCSVVCKKVSKVKAIWQGNYFNQCTRWLLTLGIAYMMLSQNQKFYSAYFSGEIHLRQISTSLIIYYQHYHLRQTSTSLIIYYVNKLDYLLHQQAWLSITSTSLIIYYINKLNYLLRQQAWLSITSTSLIIYYVNKLDYLLRQQAWLSITSTRLSITSTSLIIYYVNKLDYLLHQQAWLSITSTSLIIYYVNKLDYLLRRCLLTILKQGNCKLY